MSFTIYLQTNLAINLQELYVIYLAGCLYKENVRVQFLKLYGQNLREVFPYTG